MEIGPHVCEKPGRQTDRQTDRQTRQLAGKTRSGMNYAGDDVRQIGVAHDQPPAWSYPVRLVLKLLRPHLVKVVESATHSTQ